jgi:hypothetical protein
MTNPTKIFISYRRADSLDITTKIYEKLEAAFGARIVFFDKEGIKPGENFKEKIYASLAPAEVVVVVIGPKWISLKLNEKDDKARIFDPEDYVHREVRVALDLPKLVIPVLVKGASMPSDKVLPHQLAELSKRNAITIHYDEKKSDEENFDEDVKKLIDEIATKVPRRKPIKLLAALAVIAVVILALLYSVFRPTQPPEIAVTVQGDLANCPAVTDFQTALASKIDDDYPHVAITDDNSSLSDILGELAIEIRCDESEVILTYVPTGSMLVLWELDEIVLPLVDTSELVNMSALVLDYIDINMRPTTTERFGNVKQNFASNTQTQLPDTQATLCGLTAPNNIQPMDDTIAQFTLLQGNSALFSSLANKYTVAERHYTSIIFQNDRYADVAKLNYAYSILNRIILLRDSLEPTYEDTFARLEANVHCLINQASSSDDPVIAYKATISHAIVYAYANIMGGGHPEYFMPPIADGLIDDSNINPELEDAPDRIIAAVQYCDAAIAYHDRIPAELQTLSDYCIGVMYTYLDKVELYDLSGDVDIRDISTDFGFNTDISLENTNLLDMMYWRAYIGLRQHEQLDESTETCQFYLRQLDDRLGDTLRSTTETNASPLPDTYQLLDERDLFSEFCV